MASVPDIRNQFDSVLLDCRSLFTHSRNPVARHSAAGIESAFLEAFKAWEVFLEDLTIAYLTGEKDITGNNPPVTLLVYDVEVCRTIVNGFQNYGNWASVDWVTRRFPVWFAPSTLENKLNVGLTELKEMTTCRNAIAHSSGHAYNRLVDLWRGKRGSSGATTSVRTADVLLSPYRPNPPLTWFDRYIQVLEVLADNLVQI